MFNTRHISFLAVGLGIWGLFASAPGTAFADSSGDITSTIDGLLGGLPAAATPIDLEISFDGYTIFDGGGSATATTEAGQYGLAIAYGADASATAEGGLDDYALADGTYALANAGSLTVGASGNYSDLAVDIGNNPDPTTIIGDPDGAYAGAGSLIGAPDSGVADSNDTAIDIGNNGLTPGTTPGADYSGGSSGAFAGDGELIGSSGSGSGDTAYTIGNIDGINDGSMAVQGNDNYASMIGSETGIEEGSYAADGNNNVAIAATNYSATGYSADASDGNDNLAYILGPDNSGAYAGTGNNDIAYIMDPFSSTGTPDSALAGDGFNSDIAEVLFTHGLANADTANYLYDIISLFGNFAG